jgi:hypothetical protein
MGRKEGAKGQGNGTFQVVESGKIDRNPHGYGIIVVSVELVSPPLFLGLVHSDRVFGRGSLSPRGRLISLGRIAPLGGIFGLGFCNCGQEG